MTGVVVVGAGESGVRAAFALRERGFDGSITLLSAEVVLPYERPPLSKGIAAEPVLIRQCAAYEQANITLRLAVAVDVIRAEEHLLELSTGEMLGFTQLLLTTGAKARLFPALAACLTLRTDMDAEIIFSRLQPSTKLGIIGGGFIGLELAAVASARGVDVTVYEAGSRLLGRAVPAEIASLVRARHEAQGVRFCLAAAVAKANGSSVMLDDGSVEVFDTVVAGVGSEPNTGLARAAGLAVDNGIQVDGAFRTSHTDVFAAGDCCNFDWRGKRLRLESWRAAQDQGEHVAAAMLGEDAAYDKVPWFWSEQYELNLQVAGLFNLDRPVFSRETNNDCRIVFQCDESGALQAAAGMGPGLAMAKDIRIFEKLIERRVAVDAMQLADPSQNLKRLLKTA